MLFQEIFGLLIPFFVVFIIPTINAKGIQSKDRESEKE